MVCAFVSIGRTIGQDGLISRTTWPEISCQKPNVWPNVCGGARQMTPVRAERAQRACVACKRIRQKCSPGEGHRARPGLGAHFSLFGNPACERTNERTFGLGQILASFVFHLPNCSQHCTRSTSSTIHLHNSHVLIRN